MTTIEVSLKEAMEIAGAIAVALVDYQSGMMLGSAGGGIDLEVAAAGNTEVVRAKMATMAQLGLDDTIEDILITLGKQYHLIRPITGANGAGLFLYLAVSKAQANLAMARRQLAAIEGNLVV
jgi:hypothetical protein